MTENEQKIINKISDLSGDYKCYDNRINREESLVLDRLLSENQQYREIGTVEKIKEELDRLRNDNECQGLYFTLEERKALAKQSRELSEYKAIGTIEELKVLKEKSVAKKPHSISIANDIGNSMVECPICHARSDYDVKSIKRGYCWKCGQKLDWSE